MSRVDALPLIDIHEPVAPDWWPPAPGWWLLVLLVMLVLGALAWRRWRRTERRRRAGRLFDEAVAGAQTPAQRIAAMSELLRRAARRCDPDADRLSGEAWLVFLDRGLPQPVFSTGVGRALLDGGFRRDPGEVDIAALQALARARFIGWMVLR